MALQQTPITRIVVYSVLIILALTGLVAAYVQATRANQTVNIDATVAAAVQATLTAYPTPTVYPTTYPTAYATASRPAPTADQACGSNPSIYPKIYRKYEADENAQLLELPKPALTADALANKAKAVSKTQIQLVLAPCGVMDYFVFRGYSPFGLAITAQKAARQITFIPEGGA